MRPEALERNKHSINRQTCKDYEHFLIVDRYRQGKHWANAQIYNYRHTYKGKYISILDDDDYLTDALFIENLKMIAEEYNPDVIFCKGKLYNCRGEFTMPKTWKMRPMRGCVASPNFIVKKGLFVQHAHKWDVSAAGDYNFINAVFDSHPEVFWWDNEVWYAKASLGKVEENVVNKQ